MSKIYWRVSCLVCGSHDLSIGSAKIHPFIVEICELDSAETTSSLCNKCSLFFSSARFDTSNIYKNYRGHTYTKIRVSHEPEYASRIAGISVRQPYLEDVEAFIRQNVPIKPSSQILDYGAGSGINTLFKEIAEIYDPYTLGKISTDHYDLVTLCHVLEHVNNPTSVVKNCLNLVKPGGALYIEIPLHGLPFKRKLWHEHINFFTEKTFGKIFELMKPLYNLSRFEIRKFKCGYESKNFSESLGVLFFKNL